jgi:MFS family permease
VAEGRFSQGLVAALLAASLLPLNSTMISVALPDIGHEFDQSAGTVTQTLVGTYLVAAVVLQSPGGKLGDRLGHWRVFALGLGVIGAGAALGFTVHALGALAVARVMIAAGGAVVVPATVALLRNELPPERRGRAFGLFGAVMSLAAGIGPVVGGELVSTFGWPSIFVVNLPVLAVSAVLAATARRAPAVLPSTRPRFDWTGTVLLAALLTAFVVGLETGGVGSVVLLCGCAALIVPFVWWERRAVDPVIAFALFRSVPFTAGTVLIAVQNLALYTLLFELPQVLRALLALDAASTGRLLVTMMVASVATSVVAGRLTDRFGPRPIAVGGSLACLASMGLLAVSPVAAAGELVLPLILLGIGIGLASPAAQTASLSAVDSRQSGMAAGVGSTMRYLGGVVGVAILGRQLDLGGGPHAVLVEHRIMLAVFAAALLVGLVCAVCLPSAAPRPARAATPDGGT